MKFGISSPNDYGDTERFAFNMYAMNDSILQSLAQYIYDNYEPNQMNSLITLDEACAHENVDADDLTQEDLDAISRYIEEKLCR